MVELVVDEVMMVELAEVLMVELVMAEVVNYSKCCKNQHTL
jgi:hypothetical protein